MTLDDLIGRLQGLKEHTSGETECAMQCWSIEDDGWVDGVVDTVDYLIAFDEVVLTSTPPEEGL